MKLFTPKLIVKILILTALLSLVLSTYVTTVSTTSASSGIVNSLDKKARAIFNEKSTLVDSSNKLTKQGLNHYTLTYGSGLKVVFLVTDRSIAILEYQYGSKAKQTSDQCPECNENKNKIKSSSEVDAQLRRLTSFDSSYQLISFKVLPNGYELIYQKDQTTYIFELNWEFRIIRRQSKSIGTISGDGEVDAKTRTAIIDFLNSRAALKRFRSFTVENIYRVGVKSFRIILLIEISTDRKVRYEIILNGGVNNLFDIEQSRYNVDFVPSYQVQVKINDDYITKIDQLVKEEAKDRKFQGFVLFKVEKDEPAFRFTYKKSDTFMTIQFIYDSISNKVRITKVEITTTSSEVINGQGDLSKAEQDKVLQIILRSFTNLSRDSTIQSVMRIGQKRYVILILTTVGQRKIKYQVTVNQNRNGDYDIEDSQIQADFIPKYVQFSDIESLREVDSLVRQRLPQKLPEGFKLTKIERDEPFYRFSYTFMSNRFIIDFSYDPFSKKVVLTNIRSQVVEENKADKEVKQQQQVVEFVKNKLINFGQGTVIQRVTRISSTRFLLTIVTVINKRQIRYQITVNQNNNGSYEFVDSKFLIDFTPNYQQFTNIGSLSDVDSLVRENLTKKIPDGFKLTKVERDEPLFRFYYTSGKSTIIVEFTFDSFTKRVAITRSDYNIVEKPTTQDDFYRSIPDEKFIEVGSQNQDPSFTKKAEFALQNLLPEIQKIDPSFKIVKRFYFIRSPQSIIFKFLIRTTSGLITYFYEVVQQSTVIIKPDPIDTKLKEYASNFLTNLPKGSTVEKVGKSGKKYLINFLVTFGTRQVRYQVVLNQNFQFEDALFDANFTPTLKQQTDKDSIKEIDAILRKQIPQKLPTGYQLSITEIDQPYYRYTYTLGSNKYVILFIYDPFSKKITFVKIDVVKVIEDEEQLKINEVISTITKTFVSSLPQGSTVDSVTRLDKTRYLITITTIVRNRKIRYQITVNQNSNGYDVVDSKYLIDFAPNYQEFTNIDSLSELNSIVRSKVGTQLPDGFKLTKVERDDPLFRFYYTSGKSSIIIEFTFDSFTKNLFVSNVISKIVVEPTPEEIEQMKIKQVATTITNTFVSSLPQGSTVDSVTRLDKTRYLITITTIVRNRKIRYQITVNQNSNGYDVVDSKYLIDFAPNYQEFTNIDSLSELNSIVRSKVGTQLPDGFKLTKVERDDPLFRFYYTSGKSSIIIEFTFDSFTKNLFVSNVISKIVVEPTPEEIEQMKIKQVATTITNTFVSSLPQGSTVDSVTRLDKTRYLITITTIVRNRKIRYQITVNQNSNGYDVVDSKYLIDFAPNYQEFTNIDSLSELNSIVRSKVGTQLPDGFKLTKVERDDPLFRFYYTSGKSSIIIEFTFDSFTKNLFVSNVISKIVVEPTPEEIEQMKIKQVATTITNTFVSSLPQGSTVDSVTRLDKTRYLITITTIVRNRKIRYQITVNQNSNGYDVVDSKYLIDFAPNYQEFTNIDSLSELNSIVRSKVGTQLPDGFKLTKVERDDPLFRFYYTSGKSSIIIEFTFDSFTKNLFVSNVISKIVAEPTPEEIEQMKIKQVATTITNTFVSSLPQGSTVDSVTRLDKTRYLITITTIVRNRKIRYQITVNQNSNGYDVVDSKYLIDFAPNYQEFTNIDSLSELNSIVRSKVGTQLPDGFKLTKVERDDPLFRFYYTSGKSSIIIEFTFDSFTKNLFVSNVISKIVVEPTPEEIEQMKIKQVATTITNTFVSSLPQGSTVDSVTRLDKTRYLITITTIVRNRKIRYQITVNQNSNGYDVVDSKYLIDFAPNYQEFTNIDSLSELNSIVRSKVGTQLPDGFKLTKVERDDPLFRFYYTSGKSSIIIEFTFDSFTKNLFVSNVISKIVVEPTPEEIEQMKIKQVATTITNTFVSSLPQGSTVDSVTRLDKTRYLITITTIVRNRKIRYQITVNQNSNGYDVVDSKYLIDFAPNYQEFTNIDSLSELNSIVRSKVGTQLPDGFKLTKVERDDPLFRFYYTSGKSSIIIEFTFDSFTKNLFVSNVISKIVVEPTPEEIEQMKIKQVATTITNTFVSSLPQGSTVDSVTRLDKTRYLITITTIVRNRKIRYQITVNQNSNGYDVVDSKYLIDFAPNYQEFTNIDSLSELNSIVRSKVGTQLPDGFKLTKVERDDPLFRFYYTSGKSSIIIEFTFDSFTKNLFVSNVISKIVVEPTPEEIEQMKIKQVATTITNTFVSSLPQGSTVDSVTRLDKTRYLITITTIVRNRKIRYQITVNQNSNGYDVVDSKYLIDFAPNYQEFTNIDSLSELNSIVRSKVGTQLPDGFKLTKVERDDPLFRFYYTSGKSSIIIEFTFDSFTKNLFVSNVNKQIYQQVISNQPIERTLYYKLVNYSQKQIDSVTQLLQNSFKQVNFLNSQLHRVQKSLYGYRIIYMIDSVPYEAIIRYNPITKSYYVLSWKKIALSDIQFTQSLYGTFTIVLDKQLEATLMKPLSKSNLGGVKIITQVKNRVGSDGLYYDVSFESNNGNTYMVTIYYRPEDDYSEVLSYEQVNAQYYVSQQQIQRNNFQLTTIQSSNKQLLAIFELISNSFNNLSTASIVYVYRAIIARFEMSVYTIGLRTTDGLFYEVSVAYAANKAIFFRYARAFEGYNYSTLDKKDVSQVISFYQKSVQQLGLTPPNVDAVLVKDVAAVGKFYRLVFNRSIKYCITIFVNLRGQMSIIGVNPVPNYLSIITSSSQVRPFGDIATFIKAGRAYFDSLKPQVPKEDTGPYDPSQDINCLRYNQKQCLKCLFRFYLKNSRCYQIADQCKEYDDKTGQCYSCYTSYTLVDGKCSPVNQFCQLTDQYGRCSQCYSGYALIDGQCYRTSTKTVVTSLRKQGMDQNMQQGLQKTVQTTTTEQKLIMSDCPPGFVQSETGQCIANI